MLLNGLNGISGPLSQLGQKQNDYYMANRTYDDGWTGGDMPFDQLVSGWGSVGGQGGAQGLFDEINKQGYNSKLTAQDFGIGWDKLMPGAAAYYKANPNMMGETTPNTQDLSMQVLNQTASKYLDANGNFTADKATWDADMQSQIQKYGLGAQDRSFGGLVKSFATEGALPFIAKGAAAIYGAGTGLESLMGGGVDPFGTGVDFSGNATNQFANSSFGSLGSDMSSLEGFDGLGDGGAFDMGGSSGFGGSTPIESGLPNNYFNDFNPDSGGFDGPQNSNPFNPTPDATWPANPRNTPSFMDSFMSGNAEDMGIQSGNAANYASANGSLPGASGGFAPTAMPSLGDLTKKYGVDGAKALYTYIKNQQMSKQAQELGQKASNVMGQPERQPFLNEAQQIAQGNLGQGGEAIKAAVMAQAQARAAKYGYGGTENSRSDVILAQELAKYGNDRLNALLGYTGANQSTSQTAYLASRDSMAFATQSFQGFSALAAKIGMDNSGTVGKAAEEFGSKIMSYFS